MKKILVIIILIIIAAVAWFYKDTGVQKALAPTSESEEADDSAVVEEVESVDLRDVDQEFEDIDKELNSL